jgi:toxin FitB
VPDLLVDTDILVDHLRGARKLEAPFPVAYSVVTRAELFAGRSTQEAAVQTLLAPMQELGVTREVAERAGRIRRESALRMPDALIAATALESGLSLLTRNRRDFDGVSGLLVVSPPPPAQ